MNYLNIIIDIALVLAVVLFALYGANKGLLKMFYGLIGSVVALAIAVLAVAPVTKLTIANTQIDNFIASPVQNYLAGKIPNAGVIVYYLDHDANPETPMEIYAEVYGPEAVPVPFADALNGSSLKLGAPLLEPLCGYSLDKTGETSTTLISALTDTITLFIMTGIMFIVIWIITKILMAVVFVVVKRLTQKSYIVHFSNKLLGGIMGLAMSVLAVFVVATLLQLMGNLDFMKDVSEAISKTTVAKFVFDNNIIYQTIASNVNISEVIDKILAIFRKDEF